MSSPPPPISRRRSSRLFLLSLIFSLSVEASANPLYWGGSSGDLSDGDPLPADTAALSGVWDAGLRNWTLDSSGSVYVAWDNALDEAHAIFGFGVAAVSGGSAPVVTLGEDISVNRMTLDLTSLPDNAYFTTLRFEGDRTIGFVGNSPLVEALAGQFRSIEFGPEVSVVASRGLTRSGNGYGRVVFRGDTSEIRGTFLNRSGQTEFLGSDLHGIDELRIESGEVRLDAVGEGLVEQLSDSGDVILAGPGARFAYRAIRSDSNPSREVIDELVLHGYGAIDLASSGGAGSENGVLVLDNAQSGLNRGGEGRGTLMLAVDDSGGGSGTIASDLQIDHGLGAGILPFIHTSRSGMVRLNAANRLEVVSMTSAPTDLSTWGSGSRYLYDSATLPTGEVADDLSIAGLGVHKGFGPQGTFRIADTATLTLSEGFLAASRGAGFGTVLLEGGRITAGTGELYAFSGPDANIRLEIRSEIAGDIDLVVSGPGRTVLGRTNTYTGTTYLNAGRLLLSADGAVPGELVVAPGGEVSTVAHVTDPLSPSSDITVRRRGSISFNDGTGQSIGGVLRLSGVLTFGATGPGLTLDHSGGFGLVLEGGSIRHSRGDFPYALRLRTDVRVPDSDEPASITYQSPSNNGGFHHDLYLGGTRIFEVEDSTTLPAETPEFLLNYQLQDGDVPGGIHKTGAGAMELAYTETVGTETHSNLYTGPTRVSQGTLLVTNTAGSATGSGEVTVESGAALGGTGFIAGAVTAEAGSSIVPGRSGETGALHLGSGVVLRGTYGCEIDGPQTDLLAVGGDLDIAGARLSVSLLAGDANEAEYLIATYGGSLTGSFQFSSLPYDYRIDYSVPGQIRLVGSPSAPPPSFTSAPSAEILSGAVGPVHTFVATDPAAGNLSFAIAGGDDPDQFALDSATGEIRFVSPPNHDDPRDRDGDNVYQVVVEATSDVAPFKTARQFFTVAVLPAFLPSITVQPLTQAVEVGDAVTFAIAYEAEPAATIQWQVSTDGGSGWNDLAGETRTTLTIPTPVWGEDGRQYRAVLTNVVGSVATDPATLQVSLPPVPAAFPNDQTFTPGQLVYRRTGLGRVTNIICHNGDLYTNIVTGGDRRVFRWSDPGDIASLGQVLAEADGDRIPIIADHGNHAHTKVGDYIGGTWDMAIRRVSPGVNTFGSTHPDWIATPSDHQLYWPWSLPFHWIQYGSDADGATFVRRFDRELYAWNSLQEHGVTGNYILMGNILLVTSDESLLGVLSYDISPIFQDPPGAPVLLDKLSGPVGAYIAVPWQNYLVFSRRDVRRVDIVDWSDPANLRLVTSIDTSGTPALNPGTNVPYAQAQDEFIFTSRHKINMETFETVLELDEAGDHRPPGSVAGPLGTSQYLLPIGQFLVSGAYSFEGRDGIGIWVHQAEPDTRAPSVGYHIPRDGQTSYPTGAPISILIHESLESYTIINGSTILLRPVGGEPVEAWTSFSHDDVLTLTPAQPLLENTTYEVVIPEGGIKDAVGNGIEAYSFTFSTGSSIEGGNQSPVISGFTVTEAPFEPGIPVTATAAATDPEGDPLEYRFTFGDGTPPTSWSAAGSAIHTYAATGHYDVKVQVRDRKPDGSTSTVTNIITVTVAPQLAGPFPTHSSPLALDASHRRVWAVNPDNDSITMIDADLHHVILEIDLTAHIPRESIDPRSVTVAGDGRIWVACHDADGIAILGGDGIFDRFIDTGYGSAPAGIVTSPDGATVLAALEARGLSDPLNGQLLRFDAGSAIEIDRLELGPTARAIAVSGDGRRALVTRFLSPENYGEVWDIDLSGGLALTRTIPLYRDRGTAGFDLSSAGSGVPNYVASITITPDGQWAWYTAKKDQTQAGEFFDQGTGTSEVLTHDHTVRALVGRIDLNTHNEPNVTSTNLNESARLDVDNSESPTAISFSPRGDYAFVALQGNNEVAVYDLLEVRAGNTRSTTWRIPAGAAPQGLLVDSSTNQLWVKNFLGRSVTRHDLDGFFHRGSRAVNPQTIPTVGNEKLAPEVVRGKTIFYHASDEMSFENYMSCASCHVDGMHDGRVFDFTQRGEGLRNTTDLRGRAGVGHGPVHWSGNFDEIQDFILDMMNHFGGSGLLTEGESPNPPLGAPNSGRSAALDDLAAYVTSLGPASVPRSPFRSVGGNLTPEAELGAAIFTREGCAVCHPPGTYTDSALDLRHRVGTIRTSSGNRLDSPLDGIDTPSLLGAWAGAPFFHDGQAPSLEDVFSAAGGVVLQAEDGVLGGGARVPDFLHINEDGSMHGELVSLGATGDSIAFFGVDGGSGGTGALELRYSTGHQGTLRITVNGVPHTFAYDPHLTRLEWRRHRVEEVSFLPGPSNAVLLENLGPRGISIDDLTVSRPEELALASVHRRVLDLGSAEREQLLAYLRQIDGRPGIVAPASFAQWTAYHSLDGSVGRESGYLDDPDGDQQNNLREFAFGTHPLVAEDPPVSRGPSLLFRDGRPLVRFPRRSRFGAEGPSYLVEFSRNLTDWETVAEAPSIVRLLDPVHELVELPFPSADEYSRGGFYRITISD